MHVVKLRHILLNGWSIKQLRLYFLSYFFFYFDSKVISAQKKLRHSRNQFTQNQLKSKHKQKNTLKRKVEIFKNKKTLYLNFILLFFKKKNFILLLFSFFQSMY